MRLPLLTAPELARASGLLLVASFAPGLAAALPAAIWTAALNDSSPPSPRCTVGPAVIGVALLLD